MKLSSRINNARHNLIAMAKQQSTQERQAKRECLYPDHQKAENGVCPHCGKNTRPNAFVCPHCGTSIVNVGENQPKRAAQAEMKAAFAVRAERILYGSRSNGNRPQKRQRHMSSEQEAALFATLQSAV